jgi:ATP-dependent Clp protease ATP-binding subunit ClpA
LNPTCLADAAVEATQLDISSLNTQLDEARERRSNLQEYESLASDVNKHPDRSQLRKRQRDAEASLLGAQDEAAEVEKQLQSRRQQFALLMTAVADLEAMYVLEDEQIAGTAAAAARAQQTTALEAESESATNRSNAADTETKGDAADSEGDVNLKSA